jgi:DNA-binding NarL/FixJ family response regulator
VTPIRVVIADDHEVVRAGLRSVLEADGDITVVGDADSGEQAIVVVLAQRPDVVVLDVRMGGMDGIAACREIRSRAPATAVLMLTSFGTEEAVMAALMAGASGFLLKNTSRADLVRAITAVAGGQSLLDPAVTRQVTDALIRLARSHGPSELATLSAREREVLVRLAHGDTNRQIADHLVISEVTARNHVSHVLEKLGLSRRSEAAALATRLRLADEG